MRIGLCHDTATVVLLLDRTLLAAVVLISTFFWDTVDALECIQCDRQMVWYSAAENERHIIRCQRGLIEPTPCVNASHTHCIFSYYKESGVTTITERRCGVADDITGCTLYKSINRRRRERRHFIGGSTTDTRLTSSASTTSIRGHRRREAAALLVEVCTAGCQTDGCVSGASSHHHLASLLKTLLLLTAANYLTALAMKRI